MQDNCVVQINCYCICRMCIVYAAVCVYVYCVKVYLYIYILRTNVKRCFKNLILK